MLRNFLVQANGAEMLRIACILAIGRGVDICAPVHDAILIKTPIDKMDEKIQTAQAAMAEASRIVLAGFELNSDVEIIKYPARYSDKRGRKMWDTIQSIIYN